MKSTTLRTIEAVAVIAISIPDDAAEKIQTVGQAIEFIKVAVDENK